MALVLVLIAVLSLLYRRDQLRLATLKTNIANVRGVAQKATDATAAEAAAKAEALPMESTVSFLVDASRTGSERAAMLDLIRRYVYDGTVIGSLDISDGKSVKFKSGVRTPDDYARFLLNLRRGTVPTGILFSKLADGSGILGWPSKSTTNNTTTPGQPATNPGAAPGLEGIPGGTQTTAPTVDSVRYVELPISIDANADLQNPVVVPVPPGGAATAAPGAAGPGGMPGGPGAPGAPGTPPAPPAPAAAPAGGTT